MSFVADALLALVGEDSAAPFELDSVRNNQTTHGKPLDAFIQLAVAKNPGDELFEVECRQIFDRAKLTKNQAEVLDLRLVGLTFEQISRCKGNSRQASMTTFLTAIKKIGRVMRVYPYTGLSEVYRLEVRRGLKKGSFGRMKVGVQAAHR